MASFHAIASRPSAPPPSVTERLALFPDRDDPVGSVFVVTINNETRFAALNLEHSQPRTRFFQELSLTTEELDRSFENKTDEDRDLFEHFFEAGKPEPGLFDGAPDLLVFEGPLQSGGFKHIQLLMKLSKVVLNGDHRCYLPQTPSVVASPRRHFDQWDLWWKREIAQWASVKAFGTHPNIVKIQQITFESLQMEWIRGVNGEEFTKDLLQIDHWDEQIQEKIRQVTTEVLKGLAFLHDHLLIHGDLKPLNIMIPYEGETKIIDFGSSTCVQQSDDLVRTTIARGRHQAIEEVVKKVSGIKSDVWAMSQLVYQLITGIEEAENDCIWKLYNFNQLTEASLSQLADKNITRFTNVLAAKCPKWSHCFEKLLLSGWQATPDLRATSAEQAAYLTGEGSGGYWDRDLQATVAKVPDSLPLENPNAPIEDSNAPIEDSNSHSTYGFSAF